MLSAQCIQKLTPTDRAVILRWKADLSPLYKASRLYQGVNDRLIRILMDSKYPSFNYLAMRYRRHCELKESPG